MEFVGNHEDRAEQRQSITLAQWQQIVDTLRARATSVGELYDDTAGRRWKRHLLSIGQIVARIVDRGTQEQVEVDSLSEEDWVEIYYALEISGNNVDPLLDLIGPDGENVRP